MLLDLLLVTVIGAALTAGILFSLYRSGRQPATIVDGRRRLSPSVGFRAVAVGCLLVSLFVTYAATQARRDQLPIAFLVSLAFLRISLFFINQAFLVRLEYDPRLLYYWTVFSGEKRISWSEIQDLGYSYAMQSHYIQTERVRRIWLWPWMRGNLDLQGIFLVRFFWQAIERAYRAEPQNVAARTRSLLTDLSKQPRLRVRGFVAVFKGTMRSANTWLLRGAAELIRPGCTDEDFERFRGTLISCGVGHFSRISANPDLLADESLEQADWFDGCLIEAVRKHDRDGARAAGTATDSESSRLSGEPWTAGDLPKLLPRLAERYPYRQPGVSDSVSE